MDTAKRMGAFGKRGLRFVTPLLLRTRFAIRDASFRAMGATWRVIVCGRVRTYRRKANSGASMPLGVSETSVFETVGELEAGELKALARSVGIGR